MCISTLANAALVASAAVHDGRGTMGLDTQTQPLGSTTITGSNTSSCSQNEPSFMQSIRRRFSRHVDAATVDVLMKSWRTSTKGQYATYLNRFCAFLVERGESNSQNLRNGLAFLTKLVNDGSSYSQLAMARSALSAFIDLEDSSGMTFGQHNLVKRFMKGAFEFRPTFKKYKSIWNVKQLFDYFRRLGDSSLLSVELLGKKLALLLTILSGGQRTQTIHAIDILDIKILPDKCIIPIYEKLKHTNPERHLKPLEFPVYNMEPCLCVVVNLKLYLQKTLPYRKSSKLFLSYQKPYSAISKDTLARWCKDVLYKAGIDTNLYSSHSSRHATTSLLARNGMNMRDICLNAGWSSERTFAVHYNKVIEEADILNNFLN